MSAGGVVAALLLALAALLWARPPGRRPVARNVRRTDAGTPSGAAAFRRLFGAGPGRWWSRSSPSAIGSLDLVADLAERLAALLRAGMPPHRAWAALAAAGGREALLCGRVAVALGGGATISAALLASAEAEPGRAGAVTSGLRWLALAWDVVERTGAPAAAVLDELAGGLRAEATGAAERSVALAGPRATGQLLGTLPLVAIVLGALVGADPVHGLLGTPVGRVCLVLGGGCWAAGHWWTRRLLAAATR